MEQRKHPMDFGLALEKNPEAVKKYETLNEYGKQAVCQWASGLHTEQELQQLVQNIAEGSLHDYY